MVDSDTKRMDLDEKKDPENIITSTSSTSDNGKTPTSVDVDVATSEGVKLEAADAIEIDASAEKSLKLKLDLMYVIYYWNKNKPYVCFKLTDFNKNAGYFPLYR